MAPGLLKSLKGCWQAHTMRMGGVFERRRIAAPCATGDSESHAVTGWFLGRERGMHEAQRLERLSALPPRGESPRERP